MLNKFEHRGKISKKNKTQPKPKPNQGKPNNQPNNNQKKKEVLEAFL